jgi:hypothetical protein
MAGVIGFLLADPQSYAATQYMGTAIPVGGLALIAADIVSKQLAARRGRIEEEKQQQETERRRQELGLGWRIPPQKQLMALSEKYGLPVVTLLQKSEPLPDFVMALPPEEKAEQEYVPDGQSELSENLFDSLFTQHWDRDRGTAGYHWEMNAEWAAEVKKLKDKDGRPLWTQRQRIMPPGYPSDYLFGCPVRTGNEFGAPNLVAT